MNNTPVLYDPDVAQINATRNLGWQSCFITFPFAELMAGYKNDIAWVAKVTNNSGREVIRYFMWMLSDVVRQGQCDEDYQWSIIHDMLTDEIDEEIYEHVAIAVASIMDHLLMEMRRILPVGIELLQVMVQEVESDWPDVVYFCGWYH